VSAPAPHCVRIQKLNGEINWYVYERRGGRRIMKHTGPDRPPLPGKTAEEAPPPPQSLSAGSTLAELAAEWRHWSHEWASLSANTQRTWGCALKRIEARWGSVPIRVFDDPRMKAKIVGWRNGRSATPRAADIGVTVLQALLKFGMLRGTILTNAAAGVPTLYKGGDRAEIIWTDEELAQVTEQALILDMNEAALALRFAAATGLRREDLITLNWSHVGEFAITKKALKKSRGKRRYASVPRIPELDSLLAELRACPRQPGVDTVLVNRIGLPWHRDWLSKSIAILSKHAGIVHKDPETGGVRKKHLHDARGTYATRLMTRAQLSDETVADIMGWSPDEVARIRRVYVDQQAVAVAIGERIRCSV
jgi:integrase